MTNQVHENVDLGADAVLDPPVILGMPPRGRKEGELTLRIGKGAHIRPFSVLYAGSTIGDFFETGKGVSIRDRNKIGERVIIGTNSVIEFGNVIGDGVRIHSGCFLEMATVGNHVFIGPGVVFTDDPHPMGCPRYTECGGGVVVEDYARIGANCTILPGVRIGRNSLVGAGSVVVEDVPEDAVVVGNPARVIKTVHEIKCHPGFFEKPYSWPPYSGRNR